MQRSTSASAGKIASLIARFEQAEQQLQRTLTGTKNPSQSEPQKQSGPSSSPQKPAAKSHSRSSSRRGSTSSDNHPNHAGAAPIQPQQQQSPQQPQQCEATTTTTGGSLQVPAENRPNDESQTTAADKPLTYSPKKSDVKSPRMVFTPPQAMLVLAAPTPDDHEASVAAQTSATNSANSRRTLSGDFATSDYDSLDTHSSHSVSSSDSGTPRDSHSLDDPDGGGTLSPPFRSPRSGYSQVNRRPVPVLKLRTLTDPNLRIFPHLSQSAPQQTAAFPQQMNQPLTLPHHDTHDSKISTNSSIHQTTTATKMAHILPRTPPLPIHLEKSKHMSTSSSSSTNSSSDAFSNTNPEEEQILQKLPINTELTERDVIPLPSPGTPSDGKSDFLRNDGSSDVSPDPTRIILSSRPTPIVDALRGGTPSTPRLTGMVTEEDLLSAYREKSKIFMRNHPDSLLLNPFLPATGSSCLADVDAGELPVSPSGGAASRSRPILRTPKSARSKSNSQSKTDRSTREETKDDFRAWKRDMERRLAEAKKTSSASESWSSALQNGTKRSPITARPRSAKLSRKTPPSNRSGPNCLSADGVDLSEECV